LSAPIVMIELLLIYKNKLLLLDQIYIHRVPTPQHL